MGRTHRIHFAGAIYHAMARGVDGCSIYADDFDRRHFLAGIRRMTERTSAEILAYCLMGNHFHLAIRVGKVPLSSCMHGLIGGHGTMFNRRHDRTGHLFQARYKAVLCLDDRYLSGLIPYIHLNPVRAGLVAAPQDWPWSSFRPGVDSASGMTDFDPWPQGSEEIDLMRRIDSESLDLDAIGRAITAQVGIADPHLRSRIRVPNLVAARRMFVAEALRNGHDQSAIAKWLNATRSTVSRYACGSNGIMGGLAPR
ncbi:MAG: transposase [Elusimicrobia bacterium]|nr:transposase [Elusimicrobiota bacterium]